MRIGSYGENTELTIIDKFGVYLSNKKIIDFVKKEKPQKIIDIGCGFNAVILQQLKPFSSNLTGVDISTNKKIKGIKLLNKKINKDLKFLKSNFYDLVIMNNVLEHLENPQEIITEIYRILQKGGTAMINVPSWRGKYFLELSAFKFGLSPIEEMNDHKMYYDINDLWPLMVKGGFKPIDIYTTYHKFGLNTYCEASK